MLSNSFYFQIHCSLTFAVSAKDEELKMDPFTHKTYIIATMWHEGEEEMKFAISSLTALSTQVFVLVRVWACVSMCENACVICACAFDVRRVAILNTPPLERVKWGRHL